MYTKKLSVFTSKHKKNVAEQTFIKYFKLFSCNQHAD